MHRRTEGASNEVHQLPVRQGTSWAKVAYLEINRKTKCVDQFELRLIFLCLKDKLERKLETPSHSQPTNGRMEIDSYDQKKHTSNSRGRVGLRLSPP